MIIEALCSPFILIIYGIVNLLPETLFQNYDLTGLVGMFNTAFQFFPADVWLLSFGSITFWITVHCIFGLSRTVLGLIPIINIGRK